MEGRTPAARQRRPNARDVYWHPWSEWWITAWGRRCSASDVGQLRPPLCPRHYECPIYRGNSTDPRTDSRNAGKGRRTRSPGSDQRGEPGWASAGGGFPVALYRRVEEFFSRHRGRLPLGAAGATRPSAFLYHRDVSITETLDCTWSQWMLRFRRKRQPVAGLMSMVAWKRPAVVVPWVRIRVRLHLLARRDPHRDAPERGATGSARSHPNCTPPSAPRRTDPRRRRRPGSADWG